MWGLATYAWLIGNYYLSAVVTFPIINAVSMAQKKIFHVLVHLALKIVSNDSVFYFDFRVMVW